MKIDWFTLATIAFAISWTAPFHSREWLAAAQFLLGVILLVLALGL